MIRLLRPLACLLAVLAVSACGPDADTSSARVRLLVSTADGPLQGEVKLMSLDDGEGHVYDTRPLSPDDPTVRVAPGAPPGRYRVFTTARWGMLWTGKRSTAAPILGDGRYPATTVRLGHPRSLYLAAADPSLPSAPISTTWSAEWKRGGDGGDVPFQPVAVEIVDQGEGIVAVRFPPEVWKLGHVMRLVGRMSDGSVTQLLSYVVRDAESPDLPRMTLVFPAAPAPLAVHLVPPPGAEQVPDGTKAVVTLLGVPLAAVYEEESYRGVVRFDTVAALGHDIRVTLPDSGPRCSFDLDPETWRRRESIHIVAQHAQAGQATEVQVLGKRFVEARVRFAEGRAFGRVPLERLPDLDGRPAARVVTQPGWQEWWLRTDDDRWHHRALDVRAAGTPPITFLGAGAGRAARVRGVVRGAGARHRVFVTQILPAWRRDGETIFPERKVGGEGFESALSPQGDYEIRVPPGRYEIRVVGPTGTSSRPRVMTFRPGGEIRLDPPAR